MEILEKYLKNCLNTSKSDTDHIEEMQCPKTEMPFG
jgi:hypothetical protein